MVRLFSQSFTKSGSYKTCLCYLAIDALLISVIGIFCYILFMGVLPPYKREFHCDDQSIRLPYKPSTVGVKFLLVVCIMASFCLVELSEFRILWHQKLLTKATLHEKLKHFLAVTTAVNTEFMLGLIIQISLMHFAKSGFGVLRPHFLDICKPNLTLLDCSANDGFILEPYCTSGTERELKQARESFPSGHSSTVVYTLGFVLLYGRSRWHQMKVGWERLSIFLFTLFFTIWTLHVMVSRVTDHWHHTSDVVGGTVLGVAVALVLLLRRDSAMSKDYYAE